MAEGAVLGLAISCGRSILRRSVRWQFTRAAPQQSRLFLARPADRLPRHPYFPGLSRGFATTSDQQNAPEVAVIGAGLTGLTTAYYLTLFHPTAKITIYEGSERLGGWVDSKRQSFTTKDGETSTVSFERGPRIIQTKIRKGIPDEWILYDLVDRMGLQDQLYFIPYGPHPLNNRYVYYPDHLVRLPAEKHRNYSLSELIASLLYTAKTILTEPVMKGMLSSIRHILAHGSDMKAKRFAVGMMQLEGGRIEQRELPDVSIGEHFSRLCGRPDIIENLLSALVHGVYGGNVYQLSVEQSLFGSSFLDAHLGSANHSLQNVDDRYILCDMEAAAYRSTVLQKICAKAYFSSYVGMSGTFDELTIALGKELQKNPNVTVKTASPVSELRYDKPQRKVKITTNQGPALSYDKVVSALYSGDLAKLTSPKLPALEASTAVTIVLVNLWYPNYTKKTNFGFGYLLPRSVPLEQNPHAALGVIFDSDRTRSVQAADYADSEQQDPFIHQEKVTEESLSQKGTMLTVMLGGHNWDWLSPQDWPDAEEAARMAKETVNLQLGIPLDEEVFVESKTCRDCIPQHLVGHRTRMATADDELKTAFGGQLAVVGGSYTAPGVLSSVKAARELALEIAGKSYSEDLAANDALRNAAMAYGPRNSVGDTGLQRFKGTWWNLRPKGEKSSLQTIMGLRRSATTV